jgi:hypothetical protein
MGSLFNFDAFCRQVSLTPCPLVGNRLDPVCYARNVELAAGTLIFQPGMCTSLYANVIYIHCLHYINIIATLVILVVALIMTGIMIYHIRSKYTAVGMCRKHSPPYMMLCKLIYHHNRSPRDINVLLHIRNPLHSGASIILWHNSRLIRCISCKSWL